MALILIVDDDQQVRTMLRMNLEQAGYDVDDAPNGEAGLRQQRARPAQLAIIDIMMPEMDGLETIMEFRRRFPDCKIIALSGGGKMIPDGFLAEAKMLGAARAFPKPIDRAEMFEAIRDLLGEA